LISSGLGIAFAFSTQQWCLSLHPAQHSTPNAKGRQAMAVETFLREFQ
jgi:hypothetical protein